MGCRLVKFDITPKENEQADITVKLPQERRTIIHGVVKDYNDNIIENAVVKLFEVTNSSNPLSMKALSYTFTDEYGQFLFGPVSPNKHYVVKVWYDDVKIVAVTVKPDKLNEEMYRSTSNNINFRSDIFDDGERV